MLKKLELVANVAIIVTATLLCVVLVKHYFISKPTTDASSVAGNSSAKRRVPTDQIQPGTQVSIPGIDWPQNERTLLLALSDKCHFCTESAEFYRRLAQEHGATRLVAVLPQTVQEGKKYLDGLNVIVDEVRQAPLNSVGIKGTPTLILIDKGGIAINSWRGKLPAEQEKAVLDSLQRENGSAN